MINHISAVHNYEKYKSEKKCPLKCLNKKIYDYDVMWKELLLLSAYNVYSDELDF